MAMASAHTREYETIYVLKPELDDKAARDFMLKMKDVVTTSGGKNIKVACWGRRKLAWERNKHQRGIFVHHSYLGEPASQAELDRMLGLDETVILRQSVLVNREIDPASRPELPDELDAPVIRERRESHGYGDYDMDSMGMSDFDGGLEEDMQEI